MSGAVKAALKWLSIGVLGVALGATLAYVTRPAPPPVGVEGARVGEQRPPLSHAELVGDQIGDLASLDQFDGKPMLINFWATWCEPCRREMPVLQSAHETYAERLVVLGVAMDDPLPVAQFVRSLGVTYPIWVGQMDVSQSQKRWGNPAGALPYTVLVDGQGVIRWQHLGEVNETQLTEALALIF